MKNFKKTMEMLLFNWKSFIRFELAYKLLSSVIFLPLFLGIFHFIMTSTGYSYLTFENIFSFLLNPFTLILLFFLLVLITFYSLFDISTIIILLDSSYHKKKITAKEAFLTSLGHLKKFFQPKNLGILFFVLFLIPFLNLGISSSFISTIQIPEFIMDYILSHSFLCGFYVLLVLFFCILFYRWIYSLHYFILENQNFKEARQSSVHLSQKHKIKDFFIIIFTQIGTSVLYLLFVFVGIFFILLLVKFLGNHPFFRNFSITIIWMFIALSFLAFTLLATPISYACISTLFYSHKEKQKEKIVSFPIMHQEPKNKSKWFFILKVSILLLALFCGTLFTYSIMDGKYNFRIESIKTTEVTAHRGASLLYPENTMSSFRGAKELGADWVELDVQQTKDGSLIILHDTNLKRTTGVDLNTWEVNYEDIVSLDAGSFFDSSFQNEKIPLLEEVILYAKDNHLKLNIELKPTGHEQDFEKSVVDMIQKYSYVDRCVVTSQNYHVLENIKNYDSSIETVYVMSLAYGDILQLKDADHFSIEASSVNKNLVKNIHNAGKEIYAWTVNTEENIQKMIDLNVDNIITDNITLAKETISQSKTSDIIKEYIQFIQKWFD